MCRALFLRHAMLCVLVASGLGACAAGGLPSATGNDPSTPSSGPSSPLSPTLATCSGEVTLSAASATDVNPPTWTWSRCAAPNPQYLIALDDPNATPTQTSTTSFKPAGELHVGAHTLYVSQKKSDGTWSDAAALTISLMPRMQRGTASESDPNVDASATYAYPKLAGSTVPASALQVSDVNGFTPDDILQGGLGDCYFAASLAAVTEVNPTYLNSLVAPLVDGYGDPVVDDQNYPLYKITMRYPGTDGAMTTWTMVTDAKLPTVNGQVAYARPSADGNFVKIGVPLLEKGFAALDQSVNFLNVVSQNGYGNTLGYVPVGTGGWATYAFIALVGNAGQTSQMASISQAALSALVTTHNTAAAVDVNNGYVNPPSTLPSGATLTLNKGAYTYQPRGGGASFSIPNEHYYSLVSVDADGTTTLRNPWGGANDGKFSRPYQDLGAIFNRFTSATLP